MDFRLIFAGLVFGGAGVMVAVHMADRSLNYRTVPGHVLSVKTSCWLEKNGIKTNEWTDKRPCAIIEAAQASDPQYKDFKINREAEVEVAYTSPADHAEHRGQLYDLTSGAKQGFDGKRAGDQINILAHKSRADKIQKL